MAGADDLDSVVKYGNSGNGTDKIISVNQGIHQNLFKNKSGNLRFAGGIDILISLNFSQIP